MSDLFKPKTKKMPDVKIPDVNVFPFEFSDRVFDDPLMLREKTNRLFIQQVEMIDNAIAGECVKIATDAGIVCAINLNKRFIADAIREKLDRQKPITCAEAIDHDFMCDADGIKPVWIEGRSHAGEGDSGWILVDTNRQEILNPSREFQRHEFFPAGDRFANLNPKSWRCWRCKPTDEARAAAEWEVSDE